MVDKNLFVYDLAAVAILKNEAPYVKEWIDYHLLAGVDHFFLYDNDSPDNLKEVLQPYIDAEIVTYTFFPGQARQYEAYNDALRYKFLCRYMTWIDGDEFIFPKSKPTIAEVFDEVAGDNPSVAGLAANLNNYGSNHHKKADLTKGVLERFTRRARVDWAPPFKHLPSMYDGNAHVSTVANPRKVKYLPNPHYAIYLDGCRAVNENGEHVPLFCNYPVSTNKIAMNHYHTKSLEEYEQKISRGTADGSRQRDIDVFKKHDTNDEFDDGILRFRDSRLVSLLPYGGMANLIQSKKVNFNRLLNALAQNLLPIVTKTVPVQFFEGKMETFLICLNLSSYLKEKFIDEYAAKFFEETALNAICRTMHTGVKIYDMLMLIAEMPRILTLPYSTVDKLNELCMRILPQIMTNCRLQNRWQDFHELEYILRMLQSFAAQKSLIPNP